MFSILFLITFYIINLIVKDYNKPIVSEVDMMINKITFKKPLKYISNNVELKSNFLTHYWDILDMTNENKFDREMIFIQAKKQTSFYIEDVTVGYKTKFSKKDIRLSEDYVLNHYDYMMNLN